MKSIRFKSFATRISLYTTVLSMTIFIVIGSCIYSLRKKERIDWAIVYVHRLLENMALKTSNKLDITETILNCNKWKLENNIENPEELSEVIMDMVMHNSDIVGGCIAFEPNYLANQGRFYMIYVKSSGQDSCEIKQFTDSSYDYFKMDWYTGAIRSKNPYWSEPYYDKGASNSIICTYAIPLCDKMDKPYAVITVDVSLTDIAKIMSDISAYHDSHFFLLSHKGHYIVHPNKNIILNKTIFDIAQQDHNNDYALIGKNMINGITGTTLFNNNGTETYALYTNIPNVGWSIGNLCPTYIILQHIKSSTRNITLLILFVLVILYLSLYKLIKTISKPLEEFSKSAKIISKGNFSSKLPVIKTSDEMQTLHHSFENMQTSLVQYINELTEKTKKQQSIASELEIARNIQQGMLPKTFPPFPEHKEIDLIASLTAAKEVGGDLYNYFIQNNKLYFIIGDVSGKGIPAAMIMAITSSLFNTFANNNSSPKEIMSILNSALYKGNETNMFVTLFLGVLDLKTGLLNVCNAGHNPIIISKGNDKPQLLITSHNIPIGLFPDYEYTENEFQLNENTLLILYTDGITEAENANHDLYELDRLKATLARCYTCNATEISRVILEDVSAHVAGNPPSDDITLMVLKYNPEATQNDK